MVVIDSPEPNAAALPGGKFVVYTGILRLLDNEDELAAVIAHEVGHVVARHHVRTGAWHSGTLAQCVVKDTVVGNVCTVLHNARCID